MIPHPPPVQDIGLRREVRLRFLCNAAFESAITFQNLLDILNVGATATTAYDLFYSVKIKFVEVWANGLANASATVTVIYDGATAGSVGDQKLHTDSSMGIEPAHVKCSPAPMTAAALYQLSSAAVAFFLNVPAGAVVDVSLSYRNPIAGNQVATQNVPVAAVAGVVYMRGLDGVAIAGTKFTPIGALATD
jgi:hypothetical protein